MNARSSLLHPSCQPLRLDLLSARRSTWRLGILVLAVLLATNFGLVRAQDSENGNPTGPTGDFNGEVATGGSYDPYTLNAKRSITDVTVPASNGTYPLAFTRTYNSGYFAVGGDKSYFGDGGNWRHSYMWTLAPTDFSGQNITAYTVAYPSGAAVTFRSSIGFINQPADIYWRGPSGTQDRLDVSSSQICLHTSDGGKIYFGANFHAASIVDPYGAITVLSYDSTHPGLLHRVTEPGGRWLQFAYSTLGYDTRDQNNVAIHYSWAVLSSLQTSTGQTVFYNYTTTDSNELHAPPNGGDGRVYMTPYCVLDNVNYDYEPSISGSGKVTALYTYTQSVSVGEGTIPLIATARDPHYSGAMANIRYQYSDLYSGLIQEEQNYAGVRVSRVDYNAGTDSSTETRGDQASGGVAITRKFIYGASSNAMGPQQGNTTNAHDGRLTSYTDFEGNSTYLSYYGPGDSNGNGNLFATTDALGRSTLYGREPYTGKVYATQLPDGRVRQSLWLDKDFNNPHPENQPYYLWKTIDERGQTTTYHRYPDRGLVSQIDYPDGSNEQFVYGGLTNDGGMTYYAKIGHQITKLGADIYYTYGTNLNNPNHAYQAADLLTCVERYYDDGNGPNNKRSEKTYFEYDAMDRLSKTTDPSGNITTFTYNSRHQLTSTTHAADNTSVSRYYDDYGNCFYVTDEFGHGTSTYYDDYRRPTSIVQSVNDGTYTYHTASFAYDPRATNSTSLSSADTHTRSQWSVSWTASGKGVERIFSPNGWLQYQFNGVGTSPGGPNGTVYVGGGPGFVYTGATYSAVGQVLTSLDAQGQTSAFTYDVCGRKKTATDPNGHVTTWSYYGDNSGDNPAYLGWPKSVTSPGPDLFYYPTVTTTCTGYDVMGRVTATVDPYSHTFLSGFDQAGDLTAQTDGAQPNNNTQPQPHNTLYRYDALGRKLSITNPTTGAPQEKWTYDASGNVHTYQNYAGAMCTYAYDGRNRCTGYSWNDGITSSTTYIYDAASRMTDVNNAHANVHYTYDDAGEVLSEQITHNDTGATGTTHYYRDQDGNLVNTVYPSGTSPCYAYDYQQRCTGVYSGSTTFSQYTFSGNWLTGRALGNGLCTTYGYQANGRVSEVWHRHGNLNSVPSGNSVSHYRYGYEPDGKISWFDREADNGESGSALENGQGDAFRYFPDGTLNLDFRNVHYNGASGTGANPRNNWPSAGNGNGDSQMEILSPDGTGYTTDTYGSNFNYEAAGNRTSSYQGYTHEQITYAPPQGNNQGDNKFGTITANNVVTNSTTTATPAYDNNFNTTNAGVNWTYVYDAENHLTNAYGPGQQSAVFFYDGLGRLCVQNVGGTFTRFYYAGSQRIEEHDYSNNLLNGYYFDTPGSDRILARTNPSETVWYQYDLMGNTSHLSNGSGTVVEQYLYDAWGQPSVYNAAGTALSGSQHDNRYLFKGAGAYEWIVPMGTYYCRARFYLPYHGRWLQTDPIGQKGGLNIYTYCGNDPINLFDPKGTNWLHTIGNIVESVGSFFDPLFAKGVNNLLSIVGNSLDNITHPRESISEGATMLPPGNRVIITGNGEADFDNSARNGDFSSLHPIGSSGLRPPDGYFSLRGSHGGIGFLDYEAVVIAGEDKGLPYVETLFAGGVRIPFEIVAGDVVIPAAINVAVGPQYEGGLVPSQGGWVGIADVEVAGVAGVGGFLNGNTSRITELGAFGYGNVGPQRFYGGGANWDVDWNWSGDSKH